MILDIREWDVVDSVIGIGFVVEMCDDFNYGTLIAVELFRENVDVIVKLRSDWRLPRQANSLIELTQLGGEILVNHSIS